MEPNLLLSDDLIHVSHQKYLNYFNIS